MKCREWALLYFTLPRSFFVLFLRSRFQLSIQFGLPDASTRREVFGLYAKQLSKNELETLATISAGMSGRDMKVRFVKDILLMMAAYVQPEKKSFQGGCCTKYAGLCAVCATVPRDCVVLVA